MIGARPLSRQIEAETGVKHESPQVLWFAPDGRVCWHADHAGIAPEALDAQLRTFAGDGGPA